MQTVKTILVSKPFNLQEVETFSKRNPECIHKVKIQKSVEVTVEQYEEMTDDPLAGEYDFLYGTSGFDNQDMEQVVEITCKNKKRFYVYSYGSKYCLCMGIRIK